MKTLREFLSEDAASDTAGTISRDKMGRGGLTPSEMPRGKQFSVADLLKRRGGGSDKGGDQDSDQQSQKSDSGRDTRYRGSGVGRKDTVGRPKPGTVPSSKRALPAGKERKSLPAGKDSMVARRTAAAKQPPQHKQISARPASTAMAGSRQRPAIRPAKSNLSRDNMGVQKVNVQDLGPTTQKRLNPAKSNRQLPPAKNTQRQLPPGR